MVRLIQKEVEIRGDPSLKPKIKKVQKYVFNPL